MQTQVFLGIIISTQGLTTDPIKLKLFNSGRKQQ